MRMLIAVFALIIVLPKVGIQCLIALYKQQRISLWTCVYAGRDLQAIEHRTILVANRPLANIDQWLHYLKGSIDLTGPAPIELNEAKRMTASDKARFSLAPGIITPYKIKKASGIAHQTEQQISLQFIENDSRSKRLMLIAVWAIQHIIGSHSKRLSSPKEFNLFGVRLSNGTMQDATDTIMNRLNNPKDETSTFAFVNADCANHYYHNDEYKQILNSFDSVFPDGIGVKIAAQHQGLALKENVNGTDMFPLLCTELNTQKKRVFLLGATKEVIQKTAQKLAHQYPNIVICGYIDGYSYNDQAETLCNHINQCHPDMLFVAMGAPRQEQWINDNISRLNVKATMGVGGLFDFYSGQVSRAPEWLRELSLEWVWRLAVQPLDKGKRYLVGNPLFLLHVFTQGNQQHSRQNAAIEV